MAEEVWPVEVPKWRPDLRIALAAGGPAKRAEALSSGADIVVIGRDNFADVEPLARKRTWKTLIIDELSGFKGGMKAKRWKVARRVVKHVDFVWGLTGTPAPNGLMDLWPQIFLLDGGERLGTTVTGFRNRYFMPGKQLANGVITEWLLRPESDKRIHEKIEDLCLSMGTEGRIELPPLTENEVKIVLPSATRSLYRTFKRDLLVTLDLVGKEGVRTAANAAVLSSKLSQISAGFLYPDDADLKPGLQYDVLHKEKINAVREITEGTGEPVVVFYRFRAEADLLMKEFPQARHINEKGVVQEWDRGDVPMLVAHPASAGHGLNLQHGGNRIIWTTMPWSLEEWRQANKRLFRQGQKNAVVIHILMADRTVDGAIRTRLTEKASVEDALLAHLESAL